MNYEKIYNDFIKDRRKKEKLFSLSDYFETHHIIPKCMGGDDKKKNLIKLTPEDHFFAHLMLAKAFGGKNWLALHSMVYRQMKTKELRYKDFLNKRKSFGLARRMVAKAISGLGNPASDRKVYTLKNLDGREITGYRFELKKITGLKGSQLSALLNLNNTKTQTLHGWYYPVKNPEGMKGIKSRSIDRRCKKIMELYHYDGRFWSGTQYEFRETFGEPIRFYKEDGTCSGWFKKKEYATTFLENKMNRPGSHRQWFKFYNKKNKETFYGTKKEARDKFNLTKRNLLDITKYKKEINGIKTI